MILMRFRHLLQVGLQVGLASTALTLGITAMASAQTAQRPPAGKPAAKPAATSPAPKPGTAAAQKPGAAAAKPADSKAASGKPAAGKPAAPSAAPGGVPATLLASFGDWGVYTAQSGKTKICYALTQPKDRQPKTASRDPAYLFVSFRPAENVKNEVAFVMGYPTKDNGAAEASIGTTNYVLLTKEANAWLKNPAEEGQAITTMSRNPTLVVKAQSRKGAQLTDRYSLTGFGPALDRARKECS
jgi:hypothetical protein